MSLLALPALFTRRKETAVAETPPEPIQAEPAALMRFLTRNGAVVELYPHAWIERHYNIGNTPRGEVPRQGFEWRCTGCDLTGAEANLRYRGAGYTESKPTDSRKEVNAHAANCWSMPKPEA